MKVLLRLLAFLRPFWISVGISVGMGVATISSGIGLMGVSAYIIATAALQPSISVLQVAIVGVRFFGISRGVFRYLERLASHAVNFKLLAKLRVWFYHTLEPLAPAGLLRFRSGDVLARAVADIETLENFYVRAIAPPLVAMAVILGVSILVGQAGTAFALILCAGLLVSGGLLPLLAYLTSRKPQAEAIAVRAELSALLVDGLQGSADLAAFRQEGAFLDQFNVLGKRSGRAQMLIVHHSAWANAINICITHFTLLGILMVGIQMVSQGKLEGVSLAVLALVTLASFEAVLPLSQAAQQLESSYQAGKRLFELADQSPVVVEPSQPCNPPESGAVSLQGVSFRYAPSLGWVLDNIDLEIKNGERAAVIGPSGAGKTTLLHLILRFWDAERGVISVGGKEIFCLERGAIHRAIGLIEQQTYLFNNSVRGNLLMAKADASENELWQSLSDAQLDQWVKTLPRGIDTWVGEHGQRLSGGERQRLAIARLLLQEPQVVLLDEPTSHVDPVTARQIHETLFKVTRGKTVIWITHDMEFLHHFDRVLKVEYGHIVEVDRRN